MTLFGAVLLLLPSYISYFSPFLTWMTACLPRGLYLSQKPKMTNIDPCARPQLTSFALPGLSRENSSSSRPGSALSAHNRTTVGGVRLRPGSAGGRRQRPLSIATTGMSAGMTASMYEERQRPTPMSTPSHSRGKGAAGMSGGSSAWCSGKIGLFCVAEERVSFHGPWTIKKSWLSVPLKKCGLCEN